MTRLDRVNLTLLELLQKDGRMSYSDIARAIKRAESTVRERVAHLENTGAIRGYRAVVDPTRLGLNVRALLRADCNLGGVADLTRRLLAIPQVQSARLTTGPKPLVVDVIAEDLTQLAKILETRLAPLGLSSIEISVVVDTLVEPRATAIPTSDTALVGFRPVTAPSEPPAVATQVALAR